MKKPYISKGKLVLITDEESKHYGRMGFNYKIEYNAKKDVCNYFISLMPDNKKIKMKDDIIGPKRLMAFKDLDNLAVFLAHENDVSGI